MKKLLFAFFLLCAGAVAQVSPQIQGAGAPTNPCVNGGQQYVDTTNHVIYGCPANGQNWLNLGLGNTVFAMTVAAGAPSNPCTDINRVYLNSSNGDFYDCPASGGNWVKVNGSGGAGTVTTTGSPATGNLTKFSGATSVTNTDLSGDATTSGTAAVTVVRLNGTSLAGLGTGILKNTTGTGVPSIAVGADLPTSGIPNVVYNNAANAATTAMTLDLSASTVANAFKVPIGAGLTSGADGVVAYDTTAKNTHIRLNAADALAVGEASAITANFIPKSNSSTLASQNASCLQDTGSQVICTEPYKFGTAAGVPNADLTVGSTTAAMTIQTTATLTNVTGMTWNVLASKNYKLQCEIPITFAASATIQFAMGGPGTPTSYNLDAYGLIGAAAVYGDFNTLGAAAYGTKTTASGAPGALTEIVHINGFIQNGTTASGTALTLQTAANGTNGITIGANAWCDLKQVN